MVSGRKKKPQTMKSLRILATFYLSITQLHKSTAVLWSPLKKLFFIQRKQNSHTHLFTDLPHCGHIGLLLRLHATPRDDPSVRMTTTAHQQHLRGAEHSNEWTPAPSWGGIVLLPSHLQAPPSPWEHSTLPKTTSLAPLGQLCKLHYQRHLGTPTLWIISAITSSPLRCVAE